MPEQVRAQDLVNKDVLEVLTKMKTELVGITDAYTKLMESTIKANEQLKKSVTTNKQLADNVKAVADNSKKKSDVDKELEKIEEKHYQTLTKMVAARSEENKRLQETTERIKREVKERKAEVDSLEGLRAKQQLLRESREKLKFSDKDYSANLKKVNAEINENDKAIKKATDSEEKRTRGIGLYKESIVKAYVAIQGSIILSKSAFSLFIDVMNSTGSTQDAFTATLEGWKQGFNAVKIAIATMDFKDFTKRVKEAVDEGRRYAEGLDEIDEKQRALKIAEAELNNTILEQRKIQNSALSTQNEKIAAGKKILQLEKDMQVIRTGIAQQAYSNELKNIASIAFGTKEVTKEMENEIEAYVRRDASMLSVIENGQKYIENQKTITELQKKQTASAKTGFTDPFLLEAVNKARAENVLLLKDYERYSKLVTPVDEKYNLLVEKRVELERAKGSALENTLRIQSRLDSAINKEEVKSTKGITPEEQMLKNQQMYVKGEKDMLDESAKEKEQRDKDEVDAKLKAEKEKNDALAKLYEQDQIEFQKRVDQKAEAEEQSRQIAQESMNLLFDIGNAFGNAEIARLEEKKEKELKSAGDNAKKKERIEAEYQKKIAAIKTKQFKADRIAALANIAINYAIAKSKVLAEVGLFGIPLQAWLTIQAALQTALVLSQPIPKFFKGVNNLAKDTLGIVGDKAPGKSGDSFELIETPKNGMFLTPNKATEMLIPKGSTIHSHEKTIEKLREMHPSVANELLKEQRLTRKALANQVHHSVNITERGFEFETQRGNARTKWLDKYIRG